MEYVIQKAGIKPGLNGEWDSEAWRAAETATVGHFHPQGTDHQPVTRMRALYDEAGLYVIFRVQDRYVRSVHTRLQSAVCKDSCVEAFLRPREDKGYFNFEINCGGTLHCTYIEDPTHRPGHRGFNKMVKIPNAELRKVKIYHSMPSVIEQEIAEPTEWHVEYFVPNEFFEQYVGPLPAPSQRRWQGNFYKCGDLTSHPHWASWAPIGDILNFHQPQFFAPIRFAANVIERKKIAPASPRLQVV